MFSLSWQLHMLGKEYPWAMVFLPTEPSTFPSEFTLGLASRITASVQIQVHLFHPQGPSLVACYLGIKSDPLIWHNDHSRAILCHPLPLPLRTQPCLHFQACGAIPAHKQGHLHPSIAPTQDCSHPCPHHSLLPPARSLRSLLWSSPFAILSPGTQQSIKHYPLIGWMKLI